MAQAGPVNWALLSPLLVAAALVQTTVPLVRVATSYRAVEQGMSLATIGVLSSAFALLPVLFVLHIGRYSDRRGEAGPAVLGAGLVLAAVVGLWLSPPGLGPMLGFTLLLGIGQVMTISALQVATTRCSGPEAQDGVLGNFLIATALGQMLGPLLLTAVTPSGALVPGAALFPLLVGSAAALLAAVALTAARLPRHIPPSADQKPQALRSLLSLPGLTVAIVSSGICLATNDLIVVFLPALAADRGIDASTVGLLLSLRAGASMASRLLFAWLVVRVGRVRLMMISLLAAGASASLLAVTLPLWALMAVLVVAGYSAGLALACTISVTMMLAPAASRATALSLRMTANRLGQFILPLGAGATAGALGPGSPFVIMGAMLLACGLAARRR